MTYYQIKIKDVGIHSMIFDSAASAAIYAFRYISAFTQNWEVISCLLPRY